MEQNTSQENNTTIENVDAEPGLVDQSLMSTLTPVINPIDGDKNVLSQDTTVPVEVIVGITNSIIVDTGVLSNVILFGDSGSNNHVDENIPNNSVTHDSEVVEIQLSEAVQSHIEEIHNRKQNEVAPHIRHVNTNPKKPKQQNKQRDANQKRLNQLQSKKVENPKPVNLEKLVNLKDIIANNHMKNGGKTKQNSLGKLLPNIKSKVFVVKVDEDGITHINAGFNGKTNIGKLLDMYAFTPFSIEDLGGFNCIGGLQHYLTGDYDERFRTLNGHKAREEGKKVTSKTINGLKLILAEATWFKVCQNEVVMNGLLNSDLPFYCYYVKNDTPVMSKLNNWYTKVLEECRRVIKLNDSNLKEFVSSGKDTKDMVIEEPNFSFLDESNPSNRNR